MAVQDMRREYGKGPLLERDVDADPVEQFRRWFADATGIGGEAFEPNAMTLATCGKDGVPAARIVLLKEFGPRGFVFYGNYGSEKGRHLAENPVAALCFFWAPLERQVRVVGGVEKTGREEAEAYFHSRPRGSQIGAVASRQSTPLTDRDALDAKMAELTRRYEGQEVPMPDDWGGWRLTPWRFEFWQGQRSRLHDRIVYTRDGSGSWKIERLAP